jgi:hypothetical protein
MQGLSVLREQTVDFIKDNPVDLTLKRVTKQDDGAGGHTTAETDLNPQRVRLVTQRQGAGVERRTTSGEVVRPDAVLVAPYNADVQMGDVFTWNDRRMEVVWVNDLHYELMCEVAARG